MNIAISGASGYIGKILSVFLRDNGHLVSLISSQKSKDLLYFNLINERHLPNLSSINVLIILSYSKNYKTLDESLKLNRDGTIRLIKHAKSSGIKNIIYVSSLSAFEGCRSIYGKTKLEIEKFCLGNEVKIIKPGLIFSFENLGGTFGSLYKIVNKTPILPRFPKDIFQYVIHIKDFCIDMNRLIETPEDKSMLYSCFPKPIEFNLLLKSISQFRRLVFIPVNFRFLIFLLNILEKFGLRIGPGTDSLIGLLNPYPHNIIPYRDNYSFDYGSNLYKL